MSGSFERAKYDTGAYERDLKQATDPLKYSLDPVRNQRCDPCRVPTPGYIGKVGVSVTHQRPLVDVESDLKNLHIRATKNPTAMYQPHCPQCGECNEGYPCGGGVVAGCQNCQEKLFHLPSCDFMTDYTRISNPICTARELGLNRFQPLCLNPQDEARWLHPSKVGINYRMVVKDNHVPCVPVPLDPTPSLPPRQPEPQTCPPAPNSCGVHIQSMHPLNASGRRWN
jgi:hypothetical protein